MQLKVKRKIQNAELEITIDEENLDKVLLKMMPFVAKDKCVCGSEDISWEGRKTKEGFIYINRKCEKCGKTSVMGHYREGGGLFWKDWIKYIPKEQQPQPPNTPSNQPPSSF